MNPNKSGTLLWNSRITEETVESKTEVRITFIVPTVWMVTLSNLDPQRQQELVYEIASNLFKYLKNKPIWDIAKYDLFNVNVKDLHKDYIRLVVILNKKDRN